MSRRRKLRFLRISSFKAPALLLTTATVIPLFWISPGRAAVNDPSQASQICASDKAEAESKVSACTAFIDYETRRSARLRAAGLTYRALGWRSKGNTENAMGDLTEAIRLDESFAPAFAARGDILRDQGKCEAAILDLNSAIRLNAKDAAGYFGRASCLIAQGKSKQALSDLSDVVKLDKNNTRGLALLALGIKGRLEFAAGAFDEAIVDYSAAAQIAPNRSIIYIDRAAAWSEKGDVARTLADYDKAIRMDKNSSAGLAARARFFANQGDAARAEEDLNAAIRLDKDPGNLYLARAALSEKSSNPDRALPDLDRAIQADPKNVPAYNARGDFYRYKGDYNRAVADYQKSVELQPTDLIAFGNRALAFFYQGDFDKAANDFKKVFDERPSTYLLLWIHISRSRINREQGRDELANLSGNIKDEDWPYPLLQLFLKKKTVEETEAAANAPDQKCEAQFYIGEWQLLRDAKDEAAKALNAAINGCPKSFSEYGGAVAELGRLKR